MHNRCDRIGYLQSKFDEYNKADFGGKLKQITLLIKKNKSKDGWYEYTTRMRDGDGWYANRERLHKASITISEGCWEEDSVEGTLLHEMIHQYQAEVLDRPTSHDAIFCSMARRLERKYKVRVR
jgi:hypothetical protein